MIQYDIARSIRLDEVPHERVKETETGIDIYYAPTRDRHVFEGLVLGKRYEIDGANYQYDVGLWDDGRFLFIARFRQL